MLANARKDHSSPLLESKWVVSRQFWLLTWLVNQVAMLLARFDPSIVTVKQSFIVSQILNAES